MKIASVVALVIAAPAIAQAEGHTPTLWVTGELGMTMTPDPDSLPEMNFALGLSASAHHAAKNYVLYGEGEALFLGGFYSLRAGAVFGWSLAGNYGEITSITQTHDYFANTTTTTVTSRVYDKQIHNVMGLDLSANASSFDGTLGTVLGAGFGWMGQNVLELQMLYDAAYGAAGIRMNFTYALGEKDFSFPIRLGLDAFFDGKHPMPVILTFGIGGGSGFNW